LTSRSHRAQGSVSRGCAICRTFEAEFRGQIGGQTSTLSDPRAATMRDFFLRMGVMGPAPAWPLPNSGILLQRPARERFYFSPRANFSNFRIRFGLSQRGGDAHMERRPRAVGRSGLLDQQRGV